MAEYVTVYLSSSFEDLREHRAAVVKALNQLQGLKVIAMEDYVARDDRPLDACVADVRGSDLYVGLFAWRYGFVPAEKNPDGLSITELEMKAAESAGIPRLVFVLHDDAAWLPRRMDRVTGENAGGERIGALRQRLLAARSAGLFSDPVALGSMVANSVSNELRRLRPAEAPATAAPRLQREVTQALYLAHAADDTQAAAVLSGHLGAGRERPVRLSRDALYVQDERGIALREENLVGCHAAAVLLTARSLPALIEHDARTVAALDVMHARCGCAALLLQGVAESDVPAHWPVRRRFAVDDAAGLAAACTWLDGCQPPAGTRSVGVPVCVVAMTARELEQLEQDDSVRSQLSGAELGHFAALTQALCAAHADWRQRYRDTRHRWRPFAPDGASLRSIAEAIADAAGQRGAIQQRRRHIRLQWYPFDPLHCDDQLLRPVYRAVSRLGCVVLVDELSLFHPGLRATFRNSPFFNNDQVAIVTIAPFDTSLAQTEQLLETAARRQLAGAFDRYAVDYDPQCELAVGDERRLRRWLTLSLPATVLRLQEPQPNRAALSDLAAELGEPGPPPKRDYAWGGGGRS